MHLFVVVFLLNMELKLQADDCVWKQRKQSNNLEAPLGAGNRLSQNNSAYRRLLCLRYYFSPLDVLFWKKSASLWVFWREGLVWGRSSRSFVCNHKTQKNYQSDFTVYLVIWSWETVQNLVWHTEFLKSVAEWLLLVLYPTIVSNAGISCQDAGQIDLNIHLSLLPQVF